MAAGRDEAALRKIFSKLVEGVKAIDIIDELYESDLLSNEEFEGILDICSQSPSKDDVKAVNRRVLMAIRRRPPGFAAKLATILRKKYNSLAETLEKALMEVDNSPQNDPAPPPSLAADGQPSSSRTMAGPMDEWKVNALVALKGELKSRVKMTKLIDMLEIPAGGFLAKVEANSVRTKVGDASKMDEIIEILQGKGNKEFTTFCQMLRQCSYEVWAQELELTAERFKTSKAHSGTDSAPPQGGAQADTSTSAAKTSNEGNMASLQHSRAVPHPLSPTMINVYWPEFETLQDEFSIIVSELLEVLNALEPVQMDKILVYLRERLKPMVNGCFPTGEPANLPHDKITPLKLIQHLQNLQCWDYLNTKFLEDLIKRVTEAGSPLHSRMTQYKEDVCSKVTHTLEECKKKDVKPEPPPNYSIMAIEVNSRGNPLSFHLHQILQLRDLLVTKFGVSDALFAGFGKNSIVLYFFIPEEAVYSLCPKLESNCTALQDLHVITVVMFAHFSLDVGFQQMSVLNKNWLSQVVALEEEVVHLKQELNKVEMNRRALRIAEVLSQDQSVYPDKPLSPLKQVVEDSEQEEEPAHKRIKLEIAEKVKVDLEHSMQVYPDKPLSPLKQVVEDSEQEEEPAHKRIKLEIAEKVKVDLEHSMQSWPSPVSTLEGEVAQLRLELKKSEGNRLQLLAQLREYQAIGLERGVPLQGSVSPLSFISEVFPTPLSVNTPPESCQTQTFQTGPLVDGRAIMQSRKLPDLHVATSTTTAIMIGDSIYVSGGLCDAIASARKVQVYAVNRQTWSTLPPSPQYDSQGVAIKGQLVLLGGNEASSETVTKLVSTWNGQVWHQELPPMPTERFRPGVITYQNLVVVSGGVAEDGRALLSSIAILNITTLQWSTPENLTLPRPMYTMQCTISHGHLYVASASIEYDAATDTGTSTNTVWQLPLVALENVLTAEGDSTSHRWAEIAPTPYHNSVLLQDTAHVVAVGGHHSYMSTVDIFIFHAASNKWIKVGQLGVPRVRCAVVSLNSTSFIVCGGYTDPMYPQNTLLTSVEMVQCMCNSSLSPVYY